MLTRISLSLQLCDCGITVSDQHIHINLMNNYIIKYNVLFVYKLNSYHWASGVEVINSILSLNQSCRCIHTIWLL